MRGTLTTLRGARPSAGEVKAFALGAISASLLILALCGGASPLLGGGVAPSRGGAPSFLRGVAVDISGVHEPTGGWRRLADDGSFRSLSEEAPAEGQAKADDMPSPLSHIPLYASLPMIALLVSASGLFSGLTLGLMGLDVIGLQIVERGGDAELARCAARIAPLRERGNMLLCTLLLGNVAVNSAVSILTAEIASGIIGFAVSTILIVIFGEILPQAACSRYALQVGARTVPIVRCLLCCFYIFTKPMSIVLDWLLGHEMGTVLSRTELMEMLKLQISLGAVNEQDGEMAKQVAEGAMSFRDKVAQEVMTPLEDIYMLSADTRLGYDTIREIFQTGFSRVPVYGTDRHDYVGLLVTKDLMIADPDDEMRLGDFIPIFHRKVESFFRDTKLVDALNAFKKGGTHMGLVRETRTEDPSNPRFEIVGLVTLEDIMEEIIQAEIVDETDVYVDVDKGIRVCDGREKDHINLGVFDPVWKTRKERLSEDEIGAVAAHLRRIAFAHDSDMSLSMQALKWLIATSTVHTQQRVTALGNEVPEKEDWLYQFGHLTEACTLVLQGRLAIVVGRDGFRTEAGAFTLLAKDALLPSREYFYPDFSAHISTKEVRFLCISRGQFLKAQSLDRNPKELQKEWCSFAAFSAGECSRKQARELRQSSLCPSPMQDRGHRARSGHDSPDHPRSEKGPPSVRTADGSANGDAEDHRASAATTAWGTASTSEPATPPLAPTLLTSRSSSDRAQDKKNRAQL